VAGLLNGDDPLERTRFPPAVNGGTPSLTQVFVQRLGSRVDKRIEGGLVATSEIAAPDAMGWISHEMSSAATLSVVVATPVRENSKGQVLVRRENSFPTVVSSFTRS
jgi:hypothetical protein